jgi:hypothetical protein
MAFDHARRYAALTRRKRRILGLLEKVEAELRTLEPLATEEMIDAGVPRVSFGDMRLFFGTVVFASAAGQDATKMKRAFTRVGLGSLVEPKANIQGIKSHIRERLAAGDPVEPVISRYIRWEEVRQLRCVTDGGKPPPAIRTMDDHLGEERIA